MNSYSTHITYLLTEQIDEYICVSRTVVPYDGPWELAKGDPAAQQEEQATANFDNSLMSIFQSQYSTQQSQLAYLQQQMQPIINEGGQGYTPDQLASMRTSATDTNSQQYQNAQDALNNQITQQSGGSKLIGVAGSTTEADAALLNAEAQQQAGSQQQITQSNANLQQQNYWNAINVLNGVAAQENPLGYAGASNSAGGTVSNLSEAVTSANQSQLLGALGGVAAGVGSALGGGFMKGGLFNPGPATGCWIAASFFGWNDIRTWMLRLWLHTEAPKWFRNFYMQYGERIARTPVRWAFRPIFYAVLGA